MVRNYLGSKARYLLCCEPESSSNRHRAEELGCDGCAGHGGIAERLGLMIFETYLDTVNEGRIHFGLDQIRNRRRQMQLI